ncbi:MAG TPA: heptaprenyl diphosphate synthase [Firmicutes bacterium]|nr:heptaprenyl diphosphate synthase [Bacillota bacterium]
MNRNNNRENLERMILVVLISSLAIVLGIIESMIPVKLPIPGAKLGLANIMVLIGLYYLKPKEMFFVIMLKTVLTTLLLGTFSMFFYGFVGAILSYVTMAFAHRVLKDNISLMGISVIGGVMHNIGQIIVAMILIRTSAVGYYMMFLLPLGVMTGILVGIVAKLTMGRLNQFDLFNKFYKNEKVA